LILGYFSFLSTKKEFTKTTALADFVQENSLTKMLNKVRNLPFVTNANSKANLVTRER